MIDNPFEPDAVEKAVAALRAFGDDLDRDNARELLSMWIGRHGLTERQRAEVLLSFPVKAPSDIFKASRDETHHPRNDDGKYIPST